MSVVTLDAVNAIYHIVEAMLPRSSDRMLGLHIQVDMSLSDYGYGEDGNTLEREPLHDRRFIHFLFVRSSNYTKVFFKDDDFRCSFMGKGHEETEWSLKADHDSCWRDGFSEELTKAYFTGTGLFTGREISGKKMRPCDVISFNTFWSGIRYVKLDKMEQKDKTDDYYSTWILSGEYVDFGDLVAEHSPDTSQMGNSGLMIRGSECHNIYVRNMEIVKERKERLDKAY